MKRRNDRLDQQLGDFGPLRQPIDEIALERLLDRYGLALVCDYPQILFERPGEWALPGWRKRHAPGYDLRACYDWPDYLAADGLADTRYWRGRSGEHPPEILIDRLSSAYRILDEIYAPVAKHPAPPDDRAPPPRSGRGGARYGSQAPTYR